MQVRNRGGVKLGAPTSGGLRVGVTKKDPLVPDSQFDVILKALVNNAISLETKQCIMQRALSGCPKVTLDVMGKGVPSLLDSGSMVTLIWEGYFEKNILPLLKASLGELSEAHLLFKLSAANNSAMSVLRYFEADIKLLGFPVPQVGFLVVRDPNKLLEPQHSTQLLGVIGCNLIQLGCKEFGRIHGFEPLENFHCPSSIHPVLFTQFCSYYHQQKLWGQAESLPVNGNTSQVNVSTLGVSSEVKDGDLSSKVNAVLGQVWVSDSQQPICIPANSARIVSWKSDRIAR